MHGMIDSIRVSIGCLTSVWVATALVFFIAGVEFGKWVKTK